jgi:hypothetical protein
MTSSRQSISVLYADATFPMMPKHLNVKSAELKLNYILRSILRQEKTTDYVEGVDNLCRRGHNTRLASHVGKRNVERGVRKMYKKTATKGV